MSEKKHFDDSSGKDPRYYFKIGVNLSTFKSYIEITSLTYQIDFSKKDTFRELLGFNPKMIKEGYNIFDGTVQIIKTSAILIKCDLVSGRYINGIRNGMLY